MTSRVKERESTDRPSRLLCLISGGAALVSGSVLVVGLIGLVSAVWIGAATGWLSWFQSLWLIVIFKVHAGLSGDQLGLLTGLNLLDIVFLAVVGLAHLGLYAALRKTSRVWAFIAAVQPWLGIVLFLATKTAGRSAVMGAALVASVITLGSGLFKKTAAYVGILGSVLLLAGDVSAGVVPASPIVATLFGTGYVLLMIWSFLIGGTLLGLASGRPMPGS